MGTSKLIVSSAAFLFEVPEPDSPLVLQELQIGGSGLAGLLPCKTVTESASALKALA
jgi:hypothetical protein